MWSIPAWTASRGSHPALIKNYRLWLATSAGILPVADSYCLEWHHPYRLLPLRGIQKVDWQEFFGVYVLPTKNFKACIGFSWSVQVLNRKLWVTSGFGNTSGVRSATSEDFQLGTATSLRFVAMVKYFESSMENVLSFPGLMNVYVLSTGHILLKKKKKKSPRFLIGNFWWYSIIGRHFWARNCNIWTLCCHDEAFLKLTGKSYLISGLYEGLCAVNIYGLETATSITFDTMARHLQMFVRSHPALEKLLGFNQ